MTKTLRLLLLVSFAVFLCYSCTKEKYEAKVPILYTASPEYASDSLVLYKVIHIGDSIHLEQLDTTAALRFEVGDSLLLLATAKAGYTFINWVRDGIEVSTDPSYYFVLEGDDVDADKHYVKHHYEARFGLDYALQVIPEIHKVMPLDLLYYMDSIPKAVSNPDGSNDTIIISALHFGDNPPLLFKDTLGVSGSPITALEHIKSDPFSSHSITVNEPTPYTDYFHFYDQHRGVVKYDYKKVYLDQSAGNMHNYYIEYANVTDSVFVMGEAPYFTVYLTQRRHKESSIPTIVDYGSYEYLIISGEVTSTGFKDLYYGMKIKKYENPADAGIQCFNIDDIIIYHIDFLPFTYWDPSIHYN